jgi:hypothetical protein
VYNYDAFFNNLKEKRMTLHLSLEHLIALAAGIGILIKPKLLNYIVAGYLIFIGVVGILGIRIS